MRGEVRGRVPSIFERFGVEPRAEWFRAGNHAMLTMWRLGLGRAMNFDPRACGRVFILTTRGRRTGLARRTPLNYAPCTGGLYCVAGFGERTDWYRNLLANPDVEVWLPDGAWTGKAEVVSEPEERLHGIRRVLINSGFAARLFGGIEPYVIEDEALLRESADYRVVRIGLKEPLPRRRTADLAWLWQVGSLGFMLLALWKWRAGK